MVSGDINIELNRLCELLPYYFLISSDYIIVDVNRNTKIDCIPCIGKKLFDVYDVLNITGNAVADLESHVDKHSKVQLISKQQKSYRLVGLFSSNDDGSNFFFIGDQVLEDRDHITVPPALVHNGQQDSLAFSETKENVRNIAQISKENNGESAFESLLRKVMDEFPEALFITDNSGNVQLINRQFADIFNLKQSWNFHDKTVDELIVLIKNSFRQPHKLYEFYERIHNHNDTVVRDIFPLQNGNTIEIKFIKCTNSYTNFSGLWIVSVVTELMSQLEILKKQRRFFEYILNNIPSDIVAFDKHHRYLFVNPSAIKNEEVRKWIIGKTDYDYCRERNRPFSIADRRHEMFVEVTKSKRLLIQEESIEKSSGDQEHFLRYWYPIFDEGNEVESVLSCGLNITDRKRAEKEIADALLKQKELNEIKSNFVSLISHQFRTPLSIILSSTQLLEKYNDAMTIAKKQVHFERIMLGIRKMTKLLDDVALIAQSESEQIIFSPTEIDVDKLCVGIIDDLSFGNLIKNRIELIKESTHTTLFADEKLLKHALTNVLANALQYSDSSTQVMFYVRIQDNCLVFVVKDFGIGIPSEEQTRLFETFQRGTKVENTSGLGLGLTITKWFIELHGGTISFTSKENEGSTFTISIPINTNK